MRVIAGSARRLQLKTVEGMETRPTTDRIKETLFNILQPDLYGCHFLDLFCGSGAIGIEALSRGAAFAVMIDSNPKAAACVRDNLLTTRLSDQALVMSCDVIDGLRRLEEKGYSFDIIFMDPPYSQGLERTVLQFLAKSQLMKEETLVIVEASGDTDFSDLPALGYTVKRCKEYKTNKHLFLTRGDTIL